MTAVSATMDCGNSSRLKEIRLPQRRRFLNMLDINVDLST
jgi:hypothetical protein